MHDVATRTKNTSPHPAPGQSSSGQKQPVVTDARPDSMQLKETKEMMHGARTIAQQQAFTEAFGSNMNQTGRDASRTNIAPTAPVIQRVKKKKVAVGVAATLFSLGLIWAIPRFRKYMMDAVNDQSVQSQIVNINPGEVEEVIDDDVIKWSVQTDDRDEGSAMRATALGEFIRWGELTPELSRDEVDLVRAREIVDTLLFIDVIKTRYGRKGLKQYQQVIMHTMDTLQKQFISRGKVIEVLKMYEDLLHIKPPYDAPSDFSIGGIAHSREGAYQWDKSHDDFFQWINDRSEKALPLNARVNCWEAALAAVIDAGKLKKEEVASAYLKLDTPYVSPEDPTEMIRYDLEGLAAVFNQRRVGTIGNSNENNNKREHIQRNDILIYNKPREPRFHVMIALDDEASHYSYTEVKVMSLWEQSAKSFVRSTVGALVTVDTAQSIDICRF